MQAKLTSEIADASAWRFVYPPILYHLFFTRNTLLEKTLENEI
ncbi:hypothetical protein [Paenibacillus thiaminolyticus]|nr:hypothetical protein [Paenibacillus thiaminolyticus]